MLLPIGAHLRLITLRLRRPRLEFTGSSRSSFSASRRSLALVPRGEWRRGRVACGGPPARRAGTRARPDPRPPAGPPRASGCGSRSAPAADRKTPVSTRSGRLLRSTIRAPRKCVFNSSSAVSISQRSWSSAASSRAGARSGSSTVVTDPVQRLGVLDPFQPVLDHAQLRSAELAQIRAVRQAPPAKQDLLRLDPPQQLCTRRTGPLNCVSIKGGILGRSGTESSRNRFSHPIGVGWPIPDEKARRGTGLCRWTRLSRTLTPFSVPSRATGCDPAASLARERTCQLSPGVVRNR